MSGDNNFSIIISTKIKGSHGNKARAGESTFSFTNLPKVSLKIELFHKYSVY